MKKLTTDEMNDILVDELTDREQKGPDAKEFRKELRKDIKLAREKGWDITIPAEWEVGD
jgi:hypothetical protein